MTEEVKKPAATAKKTATAPVKPQGLQVKYLGRSFIRQPSTGVTIGHGQTQFVKEDGWADNQIKSGLLVVV